MPSLSVTPEILAFGDVLFGNTSSEMTFQLTGENLIADIELYGNLDYYGFEISLTTGTGFSNELTIPYGTGTIDQTIYVRCSPNFTGFVVMDLEIESGTYGYASVELNSTGLTTISVTPSNLDFGNTQVNSSSKLSYTLDCENLETTNGDENITVTAPAGEYQVCLTENGTYANSVEAVPTSGTIAQTIWVQFSPTSAGTQTGNVANTTGYANTVNVAVSGTGVVPTLSVSPTTLNFNNVEIGSSAEQSYDLTGEFLTANATVTAPTGFEVSLTTGTGFASSVNVTQSSGDISQTIYVKFSPTLEQTYNDYVTNESTDATTQNVTVTGAGVPAGTPTITSSVSSIDFGIIQTGYDDVQTYTVEAVDLTNDITISVTGSNYEISDDGTNFGTTNIVLSETGGTVTQTTIWVKFSPDAVQTYAGTLTHTSTDATTVNVSLAGEGVEPIITVTPTSLNFGDVITGETADLTYTIEAQYLTNNLDITAPDASGFTISDDNSTFGNSLTLTHTDGTVAETTIYVRFSPTEVTSYSTNITATSSGLDVDVAVEGNGVAPATPIITASLSSIDFGEIQTGSDDVQTYTVAASNLTEDITISVTGSNYEISEDGTTFGTDNIVLVQSGGNVITTTIYVKFAPDAVAHFDGMVSHTSTDASQVDIDLDGDGIAPILTINPISLNFGDVEISETVDLTYTIAGQYLIDDILISVADATGFTISDDNVTFGTDLTLTQIDGTINETTIYVRFAPTTETTYSTDIENTTDGATQNVALEGNGVVAGTPVTTISTTALDFGEIEIGNEQTLTYIISGVNLTDDIEISLETGSQFTISEDNTTFGTTLTLSQDGGIVAETTIYVKFAPLSKTDYSDIIFHETTDATTREIALSGSSAVGFFEIEDIEVSVYPNPTTGIFNIEVTEDAEITIIDISGKIISQFQNFTTSQVDLSNQANGIYFIKIQTENEIITRKLIKQ